MVWGLRGGFEAHLVKHGPLKEGLRDSTLWSGGSVVVNPVKSDKITPLYQLPLSDTQEYKKHFHLVRGAVTTWAASDSIQRLTQTPPRWTEAKGEQAISKESTVLS